MNIEQLYFTVQRVAHAKQNLTSYKIKKNLMLVYTHEKLAKFMLKIPELANFLNDIQSVHSASSSFIAYSAGALLCP